MGRAPCCDKANVKKGPWSPEEDMKLKEYIDRHGTAGNWIALPHKAGLRRCGKSCRLRWLNYLRPNIKHGDFSDDEDRIICNLFASIGSRWSIIASQLPGRTDNDIKNYWNTKLKKKLMGLQPPTQRSSRSSNHPQQQQQPREHHSKQQLLFHPPPPPPHAVSTLDHQAGSCLPMAICVHPHQALLEQGSLPAMSPYIVNPDGQAGSVSLLMSGRGSLISSCSSSPSSGINGNYFDLCNIFVNNGSENAYDSGLQSGRLLCGGGGGGREDAGKRLLTSQQGVTSTSTLNDKYIAAAAAAQYEEQEMKPFLVSAYNSFVQSEEPSSGGTSFRLLNADARQGRSPIN